MPKHLTKKLYFRRPELLLVCFDKRALRHKLDESGGLQRNGHLLQRGQNEATHLRDVFGLQYLIGRQLLYRS